MSTTTTEPDQDGDEQRIPTAAENKRSRSRSFALLGELISPVKGKFALMALMVVVAQLAVAVPRSSPGASTPACPS